MDASLPLSALDSVQWTEVSADADVPGALRALRDPGAEQRGQAVAGLWDALDHQGIGRSRATAQAIPFLLGLVADASTPDRARIVQLLAELVVGDTSWYLHDGFHPDLQVRPDQCARAQAMVEGGNRGDPAEHRRAFPNPGQGPDLSPGKGFREIYAAACAGLPIFLSCLEDGSVELRRAIPFVLAWLTDRASATAEPLTRRVEKDADAGVRASASLGLSHAIKRDGGALPAGLRTLSEYRARASSELERRCAALALIRLERPPDTRDARDDLCKALNAGVPQVGTAGFPWTRIDSPPFLFCTTLLGSAKNDRDEVLRAGRAALRQVADFHDAADLAGWLIQLLVPLPKNGRPPTWGQLPDDARTTLVSVVACEAAWHFTDVRDLLRQRKVPDTRVGLDSFVR